VSQQVLLKVPQLSVLLGQKNFVCLSIRDSQNHSGTHE
jgi:hypothetical protein